MESPARNKPCPCGSGKKFKHCCERSPRPSPLAVNVATLLSHALRLHQQGHIRRAEALYRQILAAHPKQADALHLLGLTRHQLGFSSDAHAYISQALELHPTNAVFLNNLGETCRALARYDEAISHFTHALQIRENRFPEAHRNLGRALLDAGQTTRALAQIDETLQLHPEYADAYYTLAEIHARQRDHANALLALDQGLAIAPKHDGLLCLKGIVLRASGNIDGALVHIRNAVANRPDIAELHHNLGLLYQQLGQAGEAALCFERELSIQPNESARHLLSALRGTTTDRAPARYVRETFDAYADQFDSHLVDKLEYRTPELLAALIEANRRDLSILDLGCGTGLMGQALRERKRRLVGLDLSPRMIEKARALDLYDELIVGDLLEWLAQTCQNPFDLIVAADVFNYLGNLEPLFEQLGDKLNHDGELLFSIESSDTQTERFTLDATGRYRHNPLHIAQLARTNGFTVMRQDTVALRKEKGADVAGILFQMQLTQAKPPDALGHPAKPNM